MIINALFRVENTVGLPPPPFAQPRGDQSFWVLELAPRSDDPKTQFVEIETRLALHQDLIKDLSARKLRLILHLAIDEPSHQPFRIPASLLHLIADFRAELEIYHDPADT